MRVDTSERKRGTYLGGHEIAALAGANPWLTVPDVYARYALGAPRGPVSDAMTAGLIIEHGLIKHAEETLGYALERDTYYVDDECPYLGGSADGVALEGALLVEVTTCNERTREHWGRPEIGSPSPMKAVQVQWLMGLSGCRRARVLCLDKSSSEVLGYWLDFDATMYATLRATAIAFWTQHISPKVPPSVIDGWGTPEHLDLIWPGSKEVPAIAADEEIQRQAREYDHARAVSKEAEERKARARAQLHALLGDATRAEWEGGAVTLSTVGLPMERIDWQKVALELRDAARVSQRDFAALVEGCTDRHPAKGRTINVRLKKEGT